MKRLLVAFAVIASTCTAQARIESLVEAELMMAAYLTADKCPDIQHDREGMVQALSTLRINVDDLTRGPVGERMHGRVRDMEKDLATSCPAIKAFYGPFGTKQQGIVRPK